MVFPFSCKILKTANYIDSFDFTDELHIGSSYVYLGITIQYYCHDRKQQKKHITNQNPNRKGLKALYLTANSTCKWPLTYPTPSVFHSDQRGIEAFLILTPGPEFWGHPQPHVGPQHQQVQGLTLEY